jgi:UDPglucose 6-dehydrogenase
MSRISRSLVRKNVQLGRLSFTDSIEEGVRNSKVVFIAVPTPPQEDGSVDLSFVENVARNIAEVMEDYRVVVDKSTVPVKTGEKVAETIRRYGKEGVDFDVVSNPEFLREGCAVQDLMKPDRIVIGTMSQRAVAPMEEIYAPFSAPVMLTDINSAELIKHASNSFLALKISYINAVSKICEASGADVTKVAEGNGGRQAHWKSIPQCRSWLWGVLLSQGPVGIHSDFRGSRLSLLTSSRKSSGSTRAQLENFLKKMRKVLWVLKEKKIGQLGLAFKGDTDDVRSSVGIAMARQMMEEGAEIKAYDPKAMDKCRQDYPEIPLVEDAYEAAREVDALVIATEWSDFTKLNWMKMKEQMRTPIIFDGRNILNPDEMSALGFEYYSIGR